MRKMSKVNQINRSQLLRPELAHKKKINRTVQEDIVFSNHHKHASTIPAGSAIVGLTGNSLKILRPHDPTDNDSQDKIE